VLDNEFWSELNQIKDTVQPLADLIKESEADWSQISSVILYKKYLESEFLPACRELLNEDDYKIISDYVTREFALMDFDLAMVAFKLDITKSDTVVNSSVDFSRMDTNLMAYATRLNLRSFEVLQSYTDFTDKSGYFDSKVLELFRKKKDNVGFWRTVARSKHAELAKIALTVQMLPCSSAAVERSFSIHKYINSPRRNKLTGQNANYLLFLKSNRSLDLPTTTVEQADDNEECEQKDRAVQSDRALETDNGSENDNDLEDDRALDDDWDLTMDVDFDNENLDFVPDSDPGEL